LSGLVSFSEEILNPSVPMALRLSGILMGELSISFGAVVVAPPKFLIAFPFDGFFSLSLSRACMREQVVW
jgi:hypothetical protein